MVFRFLCLLWAIAVARAEWRLSWSDDFNGPAGSSPDLSKWTYDLGGSGWLNDELEYYTNTSSNSVLDGQGVLNIIARDDDAAQYQCWYGTCTHTSARLKTQGIFNQTYGRFEARIKLPIGQGLWPAFWTLGGDLSNWPNDGEIDIMEMMGSHPSTNLGSMHGPGYSGDDCLSGNYTLANGTFNDDFHLFATEWFSDSVTWYVDDVAYETRTPQDLPSGAKWVFDHPFFIIMNMAIGGNFDGNPDGSYSFPQYVNVDYVRVYTWL